MLTRELIEALKTYTVNMQNTVTLVMQTGDHENRQELTELLSGLASTSEKIQLDPRNSSWARKRRVGY